MKISKYREGKSSSVVLFIVAPDFSVSCSDKVEIYANGSLAFSGVIYSFNSYKNGATISAYDNLRSLKSCATGTFINKKLSEIFNEICNKFRISSSVIDTKYIIPYLFFENKSYFEILSDAIEKTKIMTGLEYVITFENGIAKIKDFSSSADVYELDSSNILSYNIEKSYENLINYVEVYQMSVDSLYSKYSVQDDDLISKFGVIAKSYKVNKSYSASECEQMAKKYLEDGRQIDETLKISVIADKILKPFDVIKFNSSRYRVNNAILTASHNLHTYSLECQYIGGA